MDMDLFSSNVAEQCLFESSEILTVKPGGVELCAGATVAQALSGRPRELAFVSANQPAADFDLVADTARL
jgi:hypothetical protein